MRKIVYKTLLTLTVLLIIIITYLSTIGIKTDKFNSKIIDQVEKIEPSIKLKINDVSISLDLLNFRVKAKTVDTDIIYRDKIIKIENIKTNVSLKSLLNDKFALNTILISTKSIEIKDLFTFIRLFNNNPKLFIAEQFVKNGYVVSDIRLDFDETGKVKENYKINGLVSDGKIDLFKRYNLNKLNFIFEIYEKNLIFNDINFFLNDKNISIPELTALKSNNEFFISGILNTLNITILKKDFNNIINNYLSKININEILFSSKNNFKFKIDKNFQFKNFNLVSDIDIKNAKIVNSFKLKKFFPEIKKIIELNNQKIKLEYQKDKLSVVGGGNIALQSEIDKIDYKIQKKNNETKVEGILKISDNPFELKLLNYKKNKKSDLELALNFKKQKKKIILNKILLKEKKNIIMLEDLILTESYKINDLKNVKIDYVDKDNLENKLQIFKKNKNYQIVGTSFNINNIIEELLQSKTGKQLNLFSKDFKFNFDIKKIYLDKNNITKDLKGSLFLKDNEMSDLSLESKFSNQKKVKFTIKTSNNEKITTLFSDNAKPFVNRYKFIRGFNEGSLDFYSIKKQGDTKSILKIYDFKLKELPALTKVLTLASLQGIADLLSGEGIRFNEFEMNFTNNKNLITINEIYAIGPAISIMMEGYIEKNKLISLRGTLVPATTINKTIGSIPLIGNILVGNKTGEGVFGVSFKIKGPPKDLETTVNPIKTLTPRFITRTLEKIKKTN